MSVQEPEWTPEFRGQRPPFPPGNELAVQHGAYSPRKVDPLAREILEAVLSDPETAYLQAPRYAAARWAWARAEAEAQLLTEYLAARAKETDDGIGDLEQRRVRTAYLLLHRAEARAADGRKALGLDPRSWVALKRDKGVGAGAQMVGAAKLMEQLSALAARVIPITEETVRALESGDDDL
jgi:hypothetical protein